MHKIPSVAIFIVTGKKCINKQLSKHVTLVFRLCYSQVGAYYKKHFCGTKTLWVLGINSLPLEYVKKKCKTNKCIRFFYICTKIPLDKLLDILYRIVDFVFKGGTRDYIITNKFVDHGHLRKEGITSLTNFFYITDFSLLEI